MDEDRISRLTDKQRECLRLVNLHQSSKMIAPLLGITPEAVDQRIKTAVRLLGVGSRFEAALVLARHEGAYERTIYDPPELVGQGAEGAFGASTGGERTSGDAPEEPMREERSPYEPERRRRLRWLPRPLPKRGTKAHDVKPLLRAAWIVAVAIAGAVAFGVLVSGVEALVRLVRS